MQLKVFLFITFLLNVACLNIKKYPSSLVKLFADVEPMRMNEKDPSSFVELFAGANPEVINQVIGMLKTLVSEAVSSLKTLEDRKTETLNNFNTVNSDLVTANNNQEGAQEALQVATTAKSNADNAKVVAEGKQQTAQVEKEAAVKNYNDQSPSLIDEEKVLQEVIQKLRSFITNTDLIWYCSVVADNLNKFQVKAATFDLEVAQSKLSQPQYGDSQVIIPMSGRKAGDPHDLAKSWATGAMWWSGMEDINNMRAACEKQNPPE